MAFKLISSTGDLGFELREGRVLLVGRGASSDIPVLDPTISRRHAELTCENDIVRVRDLDSVNGTMVNGERVTEAKVTAGGVVTFGAVSFRLEALTASPESPDNAGAAAATPAGERAGENSTPDATIIRRQPVGDSGSPLSIFARVENLADARVRTKSADHHAETEQKLALLLEVSKGLSRAIDVDALLETIARMVFQILDADRVAIELIDENGVRVPKISRHRSGEAAGWVIPRSIARPVIADKVAILSGDAPRDVRFGGQSIIAQRVRSAMCAPLIGGENRVQGILYVDNLTTPRRFDEDDLDFLVAFSNIAAAAIENSRFAERIGRELLVRSNFERFFAPNLAARIASAPDAVRPGGEKRTVAVLFSDIRGFTALAEEMRPDDVARLLSDYFTVMVEIVFRHEGTLDKFIGDSVMAQWGAPIATPTDADRALDAARDMIRSLDELNARWLAEGVARPHLEIGIGLNYGEAFAGYVGAERRLEYTVIGDPVNTASRLCAAAGGGEILLTGELLAALANPPAVRERGAMELRGKSQPTAVYSVMP
ncbi:MAG TPA: adenylate/guanylate cyclase domain-containing protein [Gemmatimonadaceae bacterium]